MSFSSTSFVSSPNKSDIFTSSCEPLGADYFDEYLARNPVVKVEHHHSNLTDSDLFRNNDNCTSTSASSDFVDADIGFSLQNDEADKDFWAHSSISHKNPIYPQSFGKAAMSESELLNLGTITLNSPQTPTRFQQSYSQSPHDTATFRGWPGGLPGTPSKSSRNTYASGGRNSIRKTSSCPRMTRNYHRSTSDLWARNIKPASTINFYGQSAVSFMPSQDFNTLEKLAMPGFVENLSYTKDTNHGVSEGAFDFETTLSTPVSDLQAITKIEEEPQVSDMFLTAKLKHSSHEWCAPSDSSGHSMDDMLSLYPQDEESPLWWSDAASAPMAQPSPTRLHVNPQRATESVAAQLHNKVSLSFSGLPYRPSNISLGYDYLSSDICAIDETATQQFDSAQSQSEYLGQLNQHNTINPSPRQPRLTRKARFGPGDLDPPSPEPSPDVQVRKRKTPVKLPRQTTPSLEATPASAPVGFVNFTPDDSMKILTGVAPSGSSKTKARREKEALEKRRKLSQAAVRAVRAAGGDVTALADEGLLV